MEAPPFTPYWLPLGKGEGPNSWVFFVVAQIAGRQRPLAVISITGGNDEFESLQGYPLTACCQRIVTIFADPSNHRAIRAEVALAAGYYMRDGNHEYSPEPIELPDHRRREADRRRWRPWDRTRGVGFDAHTGRTAPTLLEPLATVYRDTSAEWGMVIVDITELDVIRYGIVGFAVSMATRIDSTRKENSPFLFGDGMGRPAYGPDTVIEDLRPRRAMSAAKYMTKFNYEVPSYANTGLLAQAPLINAEAMSMVWPSTSDNAPLSPVTLPIDTEQTGKYQAVARFFQRVVNADQYHYDLSYFDKHLLSIPHGRDLLQCYTLQHSDQLSTSKSFGQLIRLAFVDQKHLSLERLENLSAELISAALDEPQAELTSISFCIDRVQSTPAQVADVLSQFDTLREIYLLQSPTQESDELSVRLFEELVARPQIFSRAKIMLAGVYSSALRRKSWLPAALADNNSQLAPLDIFPVQQMLIRFEAREERPTRISHHYKCICLSDGLLRPEQFAANFLLCLSTLEELDDDLFDQTAHLFSLSSGPGSFTNDPQSVAQVSPIPAENFALPIFFPVADGRSCSPLVRDLAPGGWTVIVSYETNRPYGTVELPIHIRYAFARPRQRPITVDHPPLEPPGPEDLEVVGLKGFLAITAPEVDPKAIDHRLEELRQRLAANPCRPFHPPHLLSTLNQAQAAQLLLDSLTASRERKQPLRKLIEEADEKWDVYSKYWKEKISGEKK